MTSNWYLSNCYFLDNQIFDFFSCLLLSYMSFITFIWFYIRTHCYLPHFRFSLLFFATLTLPISSSLCPLLFFSLYFYLSLYSSFSLFLSLSLSLSPSFSLTISPSFSLSFSLCLTISLSLCLFLFSDPNNGEVEWDVELWYVRSQYYFFINEFC